MRPCLVMLSTKVDGQTSEIVRDGEMDLFVRAAKLTYREDDALVKLSLHDNKAEIVREGDYTLSLCLENGKRTQGTIGIAENVGEIVTHTRLLEYQIAEKYVAAHIVYDLIIGAERQEMDLSLLAKFK